MGVHIDSQTKVGCGKPDVPDVQHAAESVGLDEGKAEDMVGTQGPHFVYVEGV